jgi:FkbM family methyltransferase
MSDPLFALLQLDRLPSVVDIGANPIDGTPPYRPLLEKELCQLTGFEPQAAALAELNKKKGRLENYLPHVVGDGSNCSFNVCRASGMSSVFLPNPKVLKLFANFSTWGEVVDTISLPTRRLDDIAEVEKIDYLKIDVQGSELSVINNGKLKLGRAVCIQTEVSFIALYQDQPVFGDIDLALRALGLVPHAFVAINKRLIAPAFDANNPYAGLNQLIEADVVYVRDFADADAMDVEQLKHLALIAHHCYRSHDLVLNCFAHLIKRDALPGEAMDRYMAIIRQK